MAETFEPELPVAAGTEATTASGIPAPAAPEQALPAPAPLPRPNLAVGITAGVGLGVVAALVYAGFAIASDRELLAFGLLIGFAVAFGFHRFGHTRGIAPGLIAAIVTLALYFVAIFIEGGGVIAKLYDVSFIDGLRSVIENSGEFLSAYFSDGMAYLFLGVSVVAAFFYAYDQKSVRFDRAHRR
jgi:hypothetical protein